MPVSSFCSRRPGDRSNVSDINEPTAKAERNCALFRWVWLAVTGAATLTDWRGGALSSSHSSSGGLSFGRHCNASLAPVVVIFVAVQ